MNKLICPECGKEFETSHPKKRYCSNMCQIKHNNRLQSAKRAKLRKVKKCLVCGKEFKPKSSRHKYCSPECRKEGLIEFYKVYDSEHSEVTKEQHRRYYHEKKIRICREAHDNCLSCDTPDGECLFD